MLFVHEHDGCAAYVGEFAVADRPDAADFAAAAVVAFEWELCELSFEVLLLGHL